MCEALTWYVWHVVGAQELVAVVIALLALSCALVFD